MRRNFLVSLFFLLFLLFCSSSYADPYLWSAHNTIVEMKESSDFVLHSDLSTARFFCLTLEAADSDDDMPELNVNLNDRNTIPKFTINGGTYTYWNGDGMKKVTGTQQRFDIARSDSVMYSNHGTLIGSDNMGYAPTGDGGDWLHFFYEADDGLNGVSVNWEAQDYLLHLSLIKGRERNCT